MALGTREDGTIRKGVAVACGGETQDGKSMLEGSTTPKRRRKKNEPTFNHGREADGIRAFNQDLQISRRRGRGRGWEQMGGGRAPGLHSSWSKEAPPFNVANPVAKGSRGGARARSSPRGSRRRWWWQAQRHGDDAAGQVA